MPFCYGGGITTVEEAKKIITLGAEKVAISAAAINNFPLIKAIGAAVGVQSVVIVLDVAKRGLLGKYEIFLENGQKMTGIKVEDFICKLNEIEVGEIVVNSIDRDGKMTGYDYDLMDLIRNLTDVPLTALGGAGSLNDVKSLISRYKIIGAAAGSLFVFKGKYRAVLISYPDKTEKKLLNNY